MRLNLKLLRGRRLQQDFNFFNLVVEFAFEAYFESLSDEVDWALLLEFIGFGVFLI